MSFWRKLFGIKSDSAKAPSSSKESAGTAVKPSHLGEEIGKEILGRSQAAPTNFPIQVEIVVERPLDQVWEYFLRADEWKNWWGGGVRSADWQEGGTINWALGGGSPITKFIPQQVLMIHGSWMDTTFLFEVDGIKKTVMRIGESAPPLAIFTDGGAAHKADLGRSLARLKQRVEQNA